MKERQRPSAARLYSLLGVMVAIWALNFIVVKFVLRELPGLLAAGLRALIAGALIVPLYLWRHRDGAPRTWKLSDVPVMLLLGVVGIAFNQMFFVLGLARTSVAHAAIVVATTPIQVLLLSAAAGHQRLTIGELAGMMVALGGVTLIQVARTASSGTPPTVLGDFLVFLSSFSFAVLAVTGRRFTRTHDSVTMNTFAYVGGALALLPTTIYLASGFAFGAVSALAWGGLLFMATMSSVVAYLIFYYALTYIPAPRVSALSYLQPFLATLLAIPFLGEHPTGIFALGGALVLAGVFITERT